MRVPKLDREAQRDERMLDRIRRRASPKQGEDADRLQAKRVRKLTKYASPKEAGMMIARRR